MKNSSLKSTGATTSQRAWVYLHSTFSKQIRKLTRDIFEKLPVNNLLKPKGHNETLTIALPENIFSKQGVSTVIFECNSENGWGTNTFERDLLIRKSLLFILGYLANYGKPKTAIEAKINGKDMRAKIKLSHEQGKGINAQIEILIKPTKTSKSILRLAPDTRPPKGLFD